MPPAPGTPWSGGSCAPRRCGSAGSWPSSCPTRARRWGCSPCCCCTTPVARGASGLVHVGSINGREPDPLFAPYSAAKAALLNLSTSLSRAYAADGVLSTCVIPGVTVTELVEANAIATAIDIFSPDITATKSVANADRPGAGIDMIEDSPVGRHRREDDLVQHVGGQGVRAERAEQADAE